MTNRSSIRILKVKIKEKTYTKTKKRNQMSLKLTFLIKQKYQWQMNFKLTLINNNIQEFINQNFKMKYQNFNHNYAVINNSKIYL